MVNANMMPRVQCTHGGLVSYRNRWRAHVDGRVLIPARKRAGYRIDDDQGCTVAEGFGRPLAYAIRIDPMDLANMRQNGVRIHPALDLLSATHFCKHRAPTSYVGRILRASAWTRPPGSDGAGEFGKEAHHQIARSRPWE
jgi:hypothetical protein